MKKLICIIIIIASLGFVKANAQQTASKTAFNKMLSAYFDMKNALATDNVNLAGIAAKSLLESLKMFPVKKLATPQQSDWKIQAADLKKWLEPTVWEKDLKVQRKNFAGIAYAMIKLVKVVNLNNNDVFVQYCPMVRKSWLNESAEIQNPFYGSKMYDCGEVASTISKK